MSVRDSARYYWIKVKTDFLTSKEVDYIMRQKEGANYIVLYHSLCLLAVNSAGLLADNVGNILVPYDEVKIQGLTKGWFSIDTIRVGLSLFAQLGLIYKNSDGILQLTNFDNLVGSETRAAERMRITRANEKLQLEERTNGEHCSLDNRDKSLDSEDMKNINDKKKLVTHVIRNEKETESDSSASNGGQYEEYDDNLPF